MHSNYYIIIPSHLFFRLCLLLPLSLLFYPLLSHMHGIFNKFKYGIKIKVSLKSSAIIDITTGQHVEE